MLLSLTSPGPVSAHTTESRNTCKDNPLPKIENAEEFYIRALCADRLGMINLIGLRGPLAIHSCRGVSKVLAQKPISLKSLRISRQKFKMEWDSGVMGTPVSELQSERRKGSDLQASSRAA